MYFKLNNQFNKVIQLIRIINHISKIINRFMIQIDEIINKKRGHTKKEKIKTRLVN
jgi:hypothetical protein